MKPEWRRLLPLLAAFAVGALGSLLFGTGPRSIASGAGDQEPWTLPASPAPDLAEADAVWAERHPWGRPPVTAEEAAAQAVSVAMPVGVVEARGGLQALFSLGAGLPVAVVEGGATPDGGTVSSITPTVVTWRDAAGELKRHELFLHEGAAGPQPTGLAQPVQDQRDRSQRPPQGGPMPQDTPDPRRRPPDPTPGG